jgi:hypothetical protein
VRSDGRCLRHHHRCRSALATQIAQILELRAADPQQAAMRQTYLGDIAFPDGARVLEVGCGTGTVTRELAGWPSVAEVVGLDPSPPSWPAPADTTRPPRCGSGRATPARSSSRTGPLTWWSSTPLCGMCPAPRGRWVRPPGCWVLAAGWPSSTATTPPPPWPSARRIRCSPAPTPGSRPACTTPGWSGGCPGCWSGRASGWSAGAATAMSRPAGRATPRRSSTGRRCPGRRGADRRRARRRPQSRGRRRATAGRFFGHIAYASLVATLAEPGAA